MKKGIFCFLLAAACFAGQPMASVSAEALRVGDQGPEVMAVQQALSNAGYELEVDGKFGPATEAALKEYQRDYGLEVDGLAGAEVYRLLLDRDFPEISRGYNYNVGAARGLIDTAVQYLGVPYVYGGSSPNGFDCSGFVQYVYRQMGVELPRTADIQYMVGVPVSKENLVPGDLVFFAGDYVNVSHVGIYISDGNFIHASTTYGIAYDSLYRDYRVDHYVGARRII